MNAQHRVIAQASSGIRVIAQASSRIRWLSALSLAACLAPALVLAELSSTEQQIVSAVRSRSGEALQLLERSVRVNSGTMNPEGVREVGRIFAAELDELGFKTRWIDMPREMKRAGHLFAERQGGQGKRLLLIGHLDTVFEKNSPVPTWDVRGARVRGQGVTDMKGGDVIMLEALRALRKAGALDNTTITVAFIGDEERVGSPIEVARAALVEAAKRSDVALAFEGTVRHEGKDTATIGRRSHAGWRLDVAAKPGHSGGIFARGESYGAIFEAARVLDAFRSQLIEENVTFSAGVIVGGTEVTYDDAIQTGGAFGKSNVIPKTVAVTGDLRYLTKEQGERVRARMVEIAGANLPGAQTVFHIHEDSPPMSPTPGNLKLLDLYSRSSADAGLGAIEPLPPGLRGGGDIQHVADFLDCLDGIGSTGSGSHTNDEDLELASIERATIRAAIFIYRLTRR